MKFQKRRRIQEKEFQRILETKILLHRDKMWIAFILDQLFIINI